MDSMQPATNYEHTLTAIRDGEPLAVYGSAASAMATSRGALVVSGDGRLLNAARPICGGDFEVTATLTLPAPGATGASIVLAGDHHRPDEPPHGKLAVRLTLDGRAGQIWIEGGRSDRLIESLPRAVGAVERWISRGVPFTVTLRRVDDRFVVRIDGRTLYETRCARGYVGNVGLYPERAVMLVYDLVVCGTLAEETIEQSDVWTIGEHGYASYRIPGLISTPRGILIAFAEARRPGAGKGDVDIVARRSFDQGATWRDQRLVWDPGDDAFFARDPSPIYDETSGTLHLIVGANTPLSERPDEPGPQRLFRISSRDDGETWSEPNALDVIETRPELAKLTAGPAAGITLRYGSHAGRLVVPGYSVETDGTTQHSCVVYSDDRGESWHLGGFGPNPSGESTVAELPGGSLALNMRARLRDENGELILRRAIAYSEDGGESFGGAISHPELPDPNCQAHVLSLHSPGGPGESGGPNASEGGGHRLIYSGPHHNQRSHRYNMTLKMSKDGGESWPIARLIYSGYSAYSAMTRLDDEHLGLLFERDDYARLTFVRVPVSWIERE
jgi:sialidase-1